jgi:predicted transcriptional regulator
MANIIAEVRAIRELLYSDKTRGGEQFIQNLEGNIFTIGDEEVDALEFFSDGINSGPAILRYVVSDMIGATLKGNNKSIEGIDFSFEKKIKSTSEKAMKVAMKRFADMLGDLEQAQKSADDTAKELGVKSSKATFRDKKDPGVQVKVVYAYFGKLKKLPDFDKLNAAAKNYVCWFSYLADKVSQGDASMEEKVIVAKRMYDELGEYVAEITGRAVSQAKKDEKAASTEINKIMSEIEALEDFTQSKVKELNRDDEKMKTIVKKALKLHLEDLDSVGITATEEGE